MRHHKNMTTQTTRGMSREKNLHLKCLGLAENSDALCGGLGHWRGPTVRSTGKLGWNPVNSAAIITAQVPQLGSKSLLEQGPEMFTFVRTPKELHFNKQNANLTRNTKYQIP